MTIGRANYRIFMSIYKSFVVHCKKSSFDVYIGRPSEFGNPFGHKEDSIAEFKVETREEAIVKYREWVMTQPDLIVKIKTELRGKRLGCWCSPLRCHGEILAEIANE